MKKIVVGCALLSIMLMLLTSLLFTACTPSSGDKNIESTSAPVTEGTAPAESESETIHIGETVASTDADTEDTAPAESESETVNAEETEAETDEDIEIPTPTDKTYLVYERKTAHMIIIGEQCSEAELTAAQELQKYLAEITGATLPIGRDHETAPSPNEIVIGETNRATAEAFEKDDAFRIHFEGRRLHICGGSPRGTLYGVYHFLETLGCRFYTSDTEIVPKQETLAVDLTTDILESPAFDYRDLYWSTTFDETISAKLKINGALVGGGYGRVLSDTVGGGITYAGPYFVHTFKYIIPADKYFDTHPEYFSEIDGKRTGEDLYSQICMTNEEVLQITIDTVKEWLRQDPNPKLVSLSQNDSGVINSYCTCEKCRAIIEEEGSPAGPLLRFVNAVAEAIAEEFPDVYVDTLAYQYSLTPPKITKARENVVIRYCTGGCSSHPISECAQNAGIKANILAWKEVCPRLYIWDYTTSFTSYLCPFPNLNTLAANAQFFYENNVVGVFSQGNYNEGLNGEFGDLRAYLLAKLLWDPYADVEALTAEFLAAYYGDAAPYIQEYLDFVHLLMKNIHFNLVLTPETFYGLFREDMIAHFDKQWAAAKEAVKDDAKMLEHVERAELQYRFLKLSNKRGEFATDDSREFQKAEKKFYADCKRLGVIRMNEGANIPAVNVQ